MSLVFQTTDTPQYLSKGAPALQAKLHIGQADDQYEKEANYVADHVMRSSESQIPPIQRKCADCEREELQMMPISSNGSPMIQMQEEDEDFEISPDATDAGALPEWSSPLLIPRQNSGFGVSLSPPTIFSSSLPSLSPSPLICPPGNIVCFLSQLKMNIDENLANNAHHMYRIGTLFPNQPEMLENAFFRYGLGLNLLQSTYSFLGTQDSMVTPLSLATGIGLKAMTFVREGEFIFDYQLDLPNDFRLEFNIGLNGDPENLLDTSRYQLETGIGIIRPF